jgi:hypothetical protein
MIREIAIIFKLSNKMAHPSDGELFQAPRKKPTECPTCKARKCLKRHGSYERFMIILEDGQRVDTVVEIKRVMCLSCGHTHALLPDLLIPYGSYTLRFILHVIRAYLKRTGTVAELCEYYRISPTTLYAWKKRLLSHANLYLDALDRMLTLTLRTIGLISDIPALPSSFYERHGFSFLQGLKRPVARGSPGAPR